MFLRTSGIARATRYKIPEDGILHSHCRENPKPYMNSADLKYEMLGFICKEQLLTSQECLCLLELFTHIQYAVA
jgi:hypothetical protein